MNCRSYNPLLMAWEPVIEPCDLIAKLDQNRGNEVLQWLLRQEMSQAAISQCSPLLGCAQNAGCCKATMQVSLSSNLSDHGFCCRLRMALSRAQPSTSPPQVRRCTSRSHTLPPPPSWMPIWSGKCASATSQGSSKADVVVSEPKIVHRAALVKFLSRRLPPQPGMGQFISKAADVDGEVLQSHLLNMCCPCSARACTRGRGRRTGASSQRRTQLQHTPLCRISWAWPLTWSWTMAPTCALSFWCAEASPERRPAARNAAAARPALPVGLSRFFLALHCVGRTALALRCCSSEAPARQRGQQQLQQQQ